MKTLQTLSRCKAEIFPTEKFGLNFFAFNL